MKQNQEGFVATMYDLILDPKIKEEERQILIQFKNDLGENHSFEDALLQLSYDLQQLSVHNVAQHTCMSPKMNELYMKISSHKQKDIQWARGISSLGIYL